MKLKKNIPIITIFIIIGLILIFGPKKQEMLELEHKDGFSSLIKYKWNKYNILTIQQSRNIFKSRVIDAEVDNIELAGTLNSGGVGYAAAVFRDRICLYNHKGEIEACYEIKDTTGQIVSYCISDIDNDLNDEILIIEGDGKAFYGHGLAILSYEKGLKKNYEREFNNLNPWKVQVCDVDGDRRKEIALGVYKESEFHPVMAKRPFLYHWEKDDIAPFWRGSRLSRPFEDYIFFDINSDGKDEIIAIERLKDGKRLINAYGWVGFGFESIGESMPYEDITAIVRQYGDGEGVLALVRKDGRDFWIGLEKADEHLVEKAKYSRMLRVLR